MPERLSRIEADIEAMRAKQESNSSLWSEVIVGVNARLDAVEQTDVIERATASGKAEVWNSIRGVGAFLAEHSWSIIKTLGFITLVGAYALDRFSQPSPRAEDWPLRLETSQ